jgi:predicted nucleotidyltransferase
MFTTQQVTDILRQQFPYLAAEYGVTRLGLFGSYAKGRAHEQSDIDVVAEFETPPGLRFVELTDYLEQLFHTPVDVLTPARIQGIRNQQVAQDIQESIVYV